MHTTLTCLYARRGEGRLMSRLFLALVVGAVLSCCRAQDPPTPVPTPALSPETTDGNTLCDFYNTMPATGKAKLTNWCGSKSGTGSYVNGPCTGTAGAWLGVTCAVVSGSSRVTKLDTGGVGLNAIGGSLPSSIGGLDALTYLYLWSISLSGSIPSSIGGLTGLTSLYLTGNSLSGSIPSSMGALTALVSLYLSENDLSGSIPSSLGGLTGLTDLGLMDNSLSGSIPSSMGGLTKLTYLGLFYNSLSGSIPSSMGALATSTYLVLHSNALTGPIPNSFCSLKRPGNLLVTNNPGLTCYPPCLSLNSYFDGGSFLSVCSAPTPARNSTATTPSSSATIIGAVVGGVCGLLLLAGAYYYYYYHVRGKESKSKGPPLPEHDGHAGKSDHPYSPADDGTWADVEDGKSKVVAAEDVELTGQPISAPAAAPKPALKKAPSVSALPSDPWAEGQAVVASTTGAAAAAAEAVLPGILSIARELPILGPCAGVLLQFYRVYKTVGANAAAYDGLKEQVDLGADWIREIAPQLKSRAIESAMVEQALRRVVSAVHHATQVVASVSRRYEDAAKKSMAARIASALVSTVLSSSDNEKLSKALTWLKEVIAYLLQTIPTVTGLQVKAKLETVADNVSSIMSLLEDKAQAARRAEELQKLQLQASEISLNNVIGEGGFALVYTGKYHRKQVAVKVVKRKDGNKLNAREKEAIENELLITRYLADPNILHCYGFVHELDRTLVVLEFAPYGSLWEMLYDEATFPSAQGSSWSFFAGSNGGGSDAGGFPFSLSIGWLKDLCSAAAHLYSRDVKHKDIKAENLLVYAYPDRLVAKLCDFGFARQSSATMSMASGGTANFEAPEVRLTGKGSFASDVFSIGMTAVQILTRQAPGRQDWQEQVNAAMDKHPKSPAQASVHKLLLRMIDVEQYKRPNAIECAEALSAVLDSLGGDPRTDSEAPEYDFVEAIEDRVKAARKAKSGSRGSIAGGASPSRASDEAEGGGRSGGTSSSSNSASKRDSRASGATTGEASEDNYG